MWSWSVSSSVSWSVSSSVSWSVSSTDLRNVSTAWRGPGCWSISRSKPTTVRPRCAACSSKSSVRLSGHSKISFMIRAYRTRGCPRCRWKKSGSGSSWGEPRAPLVVMASRMVPLGADAANSTFSTGPPVVSPVRLQAHQKRRSLVGVAARRNRHRHRVGRASSFRVVGNFRVAERSMLLGGPSVRSLVWHIDSFAEETELIPLTDCCHAAAVGSLSARSGG